MAVRSSPDEDARHMDVPFGITRALRATRRVRDIVTVLVTHGFDDLVEGLGLDRLRRRIRRSLFRKKEPPAHHATTTAVRLRKVLEDLGPTFVKLGQILATRADLVPPEWCEEFGKLHSDAPAVPWPVIQERLREELGERLDTIVAAIDEPPIAAASMAQVHRATLRDGRKVVLKILRPGIRETIAADVQIMRTLASLLEPRFASHGYSPTDVVDQFAREIEHETDLIREGQSTERLGRAFAADRDDEDDSPVGEIAQVVRFAQVHWDLTTRSVLAMEELPGTLLAHTNAAELGTERCERIVARCADAVFRQCFEFGFFHADPHPGNLMIADDDTVGFLDCGMTGHVDPDTAERLADLVRGTIVQDLDTVVRAAVALAETEPALVYDRRLRGDIWEFMGRFGGITLGDLRVGELLHDFFDVLRRNQIRCAADLVYLIKAIGTIEGVATGLAPQFDLVDHLRPQIEKLVKRRYGFRALRRRVERSGLAYVEIAETLPFQVREILDRVQRSKLSLQVDHRGLKDFERSIREGSMTLAYAILVAALIVGSSVLMLADSVVGARGWLTVIAILGYLASAFLAFWRVAKLWFSGRTS